MKKAKVKKRRGVWIVYTCRADRAICYSFRIALIWRDVLERREGKCRS